MEDSRKEKDTDVRYKLIVLFSSSNLFIEKYDEPWYQPKKEKHTHLPGGV